VETLDDDDTPFLPDWTVSPGMSVREILEDRGMTVGDLARQTGLTSDEGADLVDGMLPIDEGLADRLAQVIGPSATFWINRERNFLADLERLGRTREGHARRVRDEDRVASLIEDALAHAGDRSRVNEAVAEALSVVDDLHDEIARLRGGAPRV